MWGLVITSSCTRVSRVVFLHEFHETCYNEGFMYRFHEMFTRGFPRGFTEDSRSHIVSYRVDPLLAEYGSGTRLAESVLVVLVVVSVILRFPWVSLAS